MQWYLGFRKAHLQFQDDAHHFLVLERIVQLCYKMVLQNIHDVHLPFHVASVAPVRDADEFCSQLQIRSFLPTFVHGPELASAQGNWKFNKWLMDGGRPYKLIAIPAEFTDQFIFLFRIHAPRYFHGSLGERRLVFCKCNGSRKSSPERIVSLLYRRRVDTENSQLFSFNSLAIFIRTRKLSKTSQISGLTLVWMSFKNTPRCFPPPVSWVLKWNWELARGNLSDQSPKSI